MHQLANLDPINGGLPGVDSTDQVQSRGLIKHGLQMTTGHSNTASTSPRPPRRYELHVCRGGGRKLQGQASRHKARPKRARLQ